MLSVMYQLGKSLNIAKKYIMKYCSNSYACKGGKRALYKCISNRKL